MNLDDPRWGVIGVAFAVVFTVASKLADILTPINPELANIVFFIVLLSLIPIYLKLRRLKRIGCQIISNLLVLSTKATKEVKGRVQILLDNKPVGDVHLVHIKIWNGGNVAIKREDYYNDNPIEIELGKEAQILEIEILETWPENLETNLKALLKFNSGNISIDPVLLINKSFILLKVLITKYEGEFAIGKTKLIDGKMVDPNKTVYFRIINFFAKVNESILGISFALSLITSYSISYLVINSLNSDINLIVIIGACIWLISSFLIYYLIIFIKNRV